MFDFTKLCKKERKEKTVPLVITLLLGPVQVGVSPVGIEPSISQDILMVPPTMGLCCPMGRSSIVKSVRQRGHLSHCNF